MDDLCDLFCRSPRELAIDELHAATAIYTCEPVVDQLLGLVRWPAGERRLVDTSCGDGAFLQRALERLLLQQPTLDAAGLLARISGWEIHPFAASQARHRVTRVLEEHGHAASAASAIAGRMVRCGDFLTEGPSEPTYHAVVGNPPYLRLTNVPEVLRTEYLEVLPPFARADLLHSFLERSARVLFPDGELACITSDRWLYSEGAARLRAAMGKHFRLSHLERLDAQSAFYRPKQRRAGTPPRVHPCAVVLSTERGAPITAQPIYPGAEQVPLSTGRTLGDLATVRLGPWLGTDGIFLIKQYAAEALPAEWLVRAVDTQDISAGRFGVPTRWAIRTAPGTSPPQPILDHLAREMPRMCGRGRRRPGSWLPPEPFHQIDLEQPSLFVPRIARTLSPVVMPAGLLAINHNLTLVPSAEATLTEIASVLASPAADDWMRATAAPLEGGYRSITARKLRSMPI